MNSGDSQYSSGVVSLAPHRERPPDQKCHDRETREGDVADLTRPLLEPGDDAVGGDKSKDCHHNEERRAEHLEQVYRHAAAPPHPQGEQGQAKGCGRGLLEPAGSGQDRQQHPRRDAGERRFHVSVNKTHAGIVCEHVDVC
jgi:hypothetical protein